jgi:hypothetical protein
LTTVTYSATTIYVPTVSVSTYETVSTFVSTGQSIIVHPTTVTETKPVFSSEVTWSTYSTCLVTSKPVTVTSTAYETQTETSVVTETKPVEQTQTKTVTEVRTNSTGSARLGGDQSPGIALQSTI